jgi:hypothetical protein
VTSCEPFEEFWLGPAGKLQQLEMPDTGFTWDPSLSETVHGLVSGGTTVTRRAKVKRTGSLDMGALDQDQADLVMRLYLRAFGPGPYCLVEPTYRNLVTPDVSMSGGHGTVSMDSWATSDSTDLVPQPNYTGVMPAAGAGSFDWNAANGSILVQGGYDTTHGNPEALPGESVPVVPGLDMTLSVYVLCDAGTGSVKLRACGRDGDSDGAQTTNLDSADTPVADSVWGRITLPVPAGTFTSKYLVLALVSTSAQTGSSIWVSAPQIEIGLEATDWHVGMGVPRVVFTGGPKTKIARLALQANTLQLSEV